MLSEKDRAYIDGLKMKRIAESFGEETEFDELAMLRKEQNRWAYALAIQAMLFSSFLHRLLERFFRDSEVEFWMHLFLIISVLCGLLLCIRNYKRADRCREGLTNALAYNKHDSN